MRSTQTLIPAALLLLAGLAPAQETFPHFQGAQLVVPQARVWPARRSSPAVVIESIGARISIREQAASTTLDIRLRNLGQRQTEAVLLLPVPDGAAVSAFRFEGTGREPSARVLPRDEARRTYDEIVRRLRDPALLEFAGYQLIQSSVFPVPAGGTQRLQLTYDHLCPADGNRVDYVLPRTESLRAEVPWRVEVDIRSELPISMVYSPSHDLVAERKGAHHRRLVLRQGAHRAPGPLRITYLRERADLSAALFAYPDPQIGGGYFLMMVGLPLDPEARQRRIPREVTVVLDRSGSMAGEKMDQARAAGLQVIEGLEEGEAFNVIDYSSQVASFARRPVRKDRDSTKAARRYLASLQPIGGTNLHDALLEALRQEPTPGTLPIVLFLTDGLPTVGDTSEVSIRSLVEHANPHRRRVFTFGVGSDVNAPLLDRVADASRATSTYVLPNEDVEVKVGEVFQRLAGPVLADLELEVFDKRGIPTTQALRELMPAQLPDLFEGEGLVLLGQYRGEQRLEFRLKGNSRGEPRSFRFDFDMARASTRNSFVPRLWATRKIAYLVDQIRQAGAANGHDPFAGSNPLRDPRYRELATEILRLSTRFGILSEYTAFLATEGTDLEAWDELLVTTGANLTEQAVRHRSGKSAVSQGRNLNERKQRGFLDPSNGFWDAEGKRIEIANVQQVGDRAFFRRGDLWVDSRSALAGPSAVDRTVTFGSPEHSALVKRLTAEGRQGQLALPGRILLRERGENVLIQND